ncbi:hypothetical protein DERF_014758 [Dermatophagoides farinae]|uniref:GH16 domain-containing protein n=1 Tax=Dermatophagoides farinae TaxID=6954 RepID=A0A922HN24_DERFA|nr:hypothetical protein DERF_014758 [Dermatophagoides farinae]
MIFSHIIRLLSLLWPSIIILADQSSLPSLKQPICRWTTKPYFDNDDNKTKISEWNLVWHDEFDSKITLNNQWTIEHEVSTCTGNWLQQEHCNTNRPENVQIIDGYLMLAARRESYYDHDFTAASMTTNQYFTHGRYEIRASNPIGNFLRTSIFTRNHGESYWHENGQIDIFSYVQGNNIIRGIHYADSTNFYEPVDQSLEAVNITNASSMNDFHLYGVEWNNGSIRFFFDDYYSHKICFCNEKKYLKPFHQLRLQIGVGGIFFHVKNLSEKIHWNCPTLVVDYVRIYQYVDHMNNNDTQIPDCHFNTLLESTTKYDIVLNKICTMTRQLDQTDSSLSDYPSSFKLTNFQFVIILISILIILFVAALIYLIVQMKKFGAKVEHQIDYYSVPPPRNSYTIPEDRDEIYEIPVYDYDALETQLERTIQNTITSKNEYLEIKPATTGQSDPPAYETIISEKSFTIDHY